MQHPELEFDRPRRRDPSINISALIDVIFILMIFVILGASFEQLRAMGVELPEANTDNVAPQQTVVVVVPLDGDIRVDGQAVDVESIAEVLRQRREDADALVIEADRGLPLQRAIDLLDAARSAGFEAVSIATRPRAE